ncbi:MAG: carboxypeptidase-like regulatory domain-containing protein [Ferruginibacter sp.]
MKFLRKTTFLLPVLILILISSCQRNIDTYVPDNNNLGQILYPSPVQASVSGQVTDENNAAVSGAVVKSGTQTTTTDSRGLFRFSNITMDKYASVVTVEINGYFKGIRTFSATEGSSNYVRVKLTPKTLIGTVDASTGGSTSLSNNSIVTLQANSVVVKSTGQAYTGIINIYAADIDPTLIDISSTIPGSFQAIDENNYRVLLKSYGMLAVQLEGQSGELLQISTGKTAKLRFTIPGSLSADAPSTIPLWSLNETDGLWKQEGSATKTGNYYEGDVSHFSFWNCDVSANTIYLELTVNTVAGPLPNAEVKLTRPGGWSSYGYTDSTGHVGGLVFSNEAIQLEVLDNCHDAVYSQNIGPFTQNTNLGTINVTLPVPSQFIMNVSGVAVDCNNSVVANGVASIYWEGQMINTPITNGNFSTTITRCAGSSSPIEIIASDNATLQQSHSWTGTATNGNIHTDTLTACGLSTEEYIRTTIDLNDYNYEIPSYFMQSSQQAGLHSKFTAMNGADSVQFTINYTNIAVGSSQQLYSFTSAHISAGLSYMWSPTAFVTITEFGNIGEYIAGTVTNAQLVISGPPASYNISFSFRIKRTF